MKAHKPNGRKAPPPTTNTKRKTEAQSKRHKAKAEDRPRGWDARTKRKIDQVAGKNGPSHHPPPTTNTERQKTRSMEAHSPKKQEDPTTHHQHIKKDRSTMRQDRQGQGGRQTKRETAAAGFLS